jgi:mannose-6-phosphate isomerase-like protein (cupin superfamily)
MATEPVYRVQHAAPRDSKDVERLTFQGVTIEVLIGAEATAGAWSLFACSAPAGFRGLALHRHLVTSETIYVVAGRLRLRVGDEEREMRPGDMGVVPPGLVHGFSNPYHEPVRLLILCTPGGVEGYLREIAGAVACAPTWPPLDLCGIVPTGERFDVHEP